MITNTATLFASQILPALASISSTSIYSARGPEKWTSRAKIVEIAAQHDTHLEFADTMNPRDVLLIKFTSLEDAVRNSDTNRIRFEPFKKKFM